MSEGVDEVELSPPTPLTNCDGVAVAGLGPHRGNGHLS